MAELSTPRRLALSAASGLLLFVAFPPMHWHWLAWIALWPLFVAVMGARTRVALLCGLVTTVAFCGLSVYWVFTVFHTHGRLSYVAAAGVQCLLLLYISTYRIAFCAALAWLSRRSHGWACLAAPFLWVTMEFAFVRTPHFSLPWNLLGYAATEQLGILQVASVTGVYGLSFLMASYAALLTRLPKDSSVRGDRFRTTEAFFGLTAVILAANVFGAEFVPTPKARFTARLVQANLSQSELYGNDWPEKLAPALDELANLSSSAVHQSPVTRHEPRFVIWPEVPAPFYLQDPRFAERAQRVARTSGGYLLLGVTEWRPRPGAPEQPPKLYPRNSAALLGPGGERLYTYDKIHLVPFGEYVPFREWLRFADSLVAEVGGFLPGSERTIGQTTQGKFATLICFEAVFPNEVREFVAGGADLLVNISNDGWLGRTGGPSQHREMARMRAVENRRWLLRATNNGHSVAIDPYGRIVAQIPPDQRAALDARYDFRSDRTIYTRFGDWFAWLCVVASGALVLNAKRKSGSKEIRK